MQLLIIEDDTRDADNLCTALSDYKPQLAITCEQAIKQLTNRPDIIIMDLYIPDKSTSMETGAWKAEQLFDAILQIEGYQPSVVFTSSKDGLKQEELEFIEQQLDLGRAEDFVLKLSDLRITASLIKRRVQSILGERYVTPSDFAARAVLHDQGLPAECKGLYPVVKTAISSANSPINVLIQGTDPETVEKITGVILNVSVAARGSEQRFDLPGDFLKLRSTLEAYSAIDSGGGSSMRQKTVVLTNLNYLNRDQQLEVVGNVNKLTGKLVRFISTIDRSEQPLTHALYSALGSIRIEIQPLSERAADIKPLIWDLLESLTTPRDGAVTLSAEAWDALETYDWPRDEPQLRDAVRAAYFRKQGEQIVLENLDPQIQAAYRKAHHEDWPPWALAEQIASRELDRNPAILNQDLFTTISQETGWEALGNRGGNQQKLIERVPAWKAREKRGITKQSRTRELQLWQEYEGQVADVSRDFKLNVETRDQLESWVLKKTRNDQRSALQQLKPHQWDELFRDIGKLSNPNANPQLIQAVIDQFLDNQTS